MFLMKMFYVKISNLVQYFVNAPVKFKSAIYSNYTLIYETENYQLTKEKQLNE